MKEVHTIIPNLPQNCEKSILAGTRSGFQALIQGASPLLLNSREDDSKMCKHGNKRLKLTPTTNNQFIEIKIQSNG